MKLLTILGATLISCTLFAQKENISHCIKRDGGQQQMMRSNSLTVAQIAETEKYDVHYYALDITMDNLSTDVAGTGEIHGEARVTLDSVLFELFPSLVISEIRLNGTPTPFSVNSSAVKVPVNLTVGQPFILEIDYAGTPPTAATNPLGGSGMTNASSPSWGNQVTWSLSESFAAYEWWPCKQSLTDKADSSKVKITVPNNCMAGSNGTLDTIVDLMNGTSRYEWVNHHPIDYYLISVSVAEYVEYNTYAHPVGCPDSVLVQNYVYNNPGTLPNFQADIDATGSYIELFAELYGPYPFQDEKYGHCMAPIGGGMEHQTMTTLGFFEKGLISHELGHQWWGDNVTCASWTDIWINEGFASYSEYLMKENMYPGQATSFMNDAHNSVKSQPGGSTWVLDSLNEGAIFSGRLVYDKGAAIIHTFRYIMDDDSVFFQTLKDFQVAFADSTAKGVDMRDAMTSASGIDYTNAFNEWYFGEGYPTYSARWNVAGNDLHLKVTHTTSSSTPLFTNPIDLRLTRSGANDTVIRVPINANTMEYVIPGMGNVLTVAEIDPANWVINKVGSLIYDANYFASVEEIEQASLVIYPNPSNGIFQVQSDIEGVQKITVRDTRGRIVQEGTFTGNYTIDLSSADNGYYIIHLQDEKGFIRVRTIAKN